MKKIEKIIPLSLLFLFFCFTTIQSQTEETINYEASISTVQRNNTSNMYSFYMKDLPTLEQTPGSRKKPEYRFLWEFGDGEYSFNNTPIHTYAVTDTSKKFKVNCHIHTIYSDEDPVNKNKDFSLNDTGGWQNSTANSNTSSFSREFKNESSDHSVFLQISRDPKAREYFTNIISYRNTSLYPLSGQVYFFYNEVKICEDCFQIENPPRHYNGEQENKMPLSATPPNTEFSNASIDAIEMPNGFSSLRYKEPMVIEEFQSLYKDQISWNVDYVQTGNECNIFVDFHTDDSKTDTSIVTNVAVVVTNRSGEIVDSYTKELKLVSAHDPNRVRSNAFFKKNPERKHAIGWKKKKKMEFMIEFQNDGDGEASNIRVEKRVPKCFDVQSLEVKRVKIGKKEIDMNDPTVFSTSAFGKKIDFNFKNISLAGTQQNDFKKSDSKGQIIYTLKTKGSMPKKATTQVSIFFDTKEPVVTKPSTIHFRKRFRTTLEVGTIFPFQIGEWKPHDWLFKSNDKSESKSKPSILANKSITLSSSPYRNNKLFFMDLGLRFSNIAFTTMSMDTVINDFGEPIIETHPLAYEFNFLRIFFSFNVNPVRFISLGVGIEGGQLLFANRNNILDYSIAGTNKDPANYLPMHAVGNVHLNIGKIQDRGPSVGLAYYWLYTRLPVTDGVYDIVNGLRAFLRVKF